MAQRASAGYADVRFRFSITLSGDLLFCCSCHEIDIRLLRWR